MTKFEEMGQAVDEAGRKWGEFQSGCWMDMGKLVEGFAKYCGIPRDRFYFLPMDEDAEEKDGYTLPGAMHYANDGFWHLGLCLKLQAMKAVLIEICLTRAKEKVLVKTGANGRTQELDLTNATECEAFYERMVNDVKSFYTTRVQAVLDNPSPVRIGFAPTK
jgi:hypothetical protein